MIYAANVPEDDLADKGANNPYVQVAHLVTLKFLLFVCVCVYYMKMRPSVTACCKRIITWPVYK